MAPVIPAHAIRTEARFEGFQNLFAEKVVKLLHYRLGPARLREIKGSSDWRGVPSDLDSRFRAATDYGKFGHHVYVLGVD